MSFNLYPQDTDDDLTTSTVTKYGKDVKPENPMRVQFKARQYLHLFAEIFLEQEYTTAQMGAIHAKRKTVMIHDFRLGARVSEISAPRQS